MIPDQSNILSPLTSAGHSAIDVHCFEKLESTSRWLRESRLALSEKLASGRAQLCVTDWQQAGVGRRGKSWQTAAGNITFSVLNQLERPVQELMGLSLVTGIAVAETLIEQYQLPMALKWPNDVIVDNLKLGGLLTEVAGSSSEAATSSQHVITGIGINVLHDQQTTTLGIGAASLEAAGIVLSRKQRDCLVGEICASVLSAHNQFEADGWAVFAQRWKVLDWLYDKEITIHRENDREHARACGVNEEGALLVESAGNLYPLFGGNVSIRPIV